MEELKNVFDEKTVEQIAAEMEQKESQERVLNELEEAPLGAEPTTMGRSEIFYLDDNNNFVSEDEATKSVIQVYDDNGNMVREVWGSRSEPVVEENSDEQYVTVYVDDDGNEVEQENATFLVMKKFIKDELISEDKYPLSKQKNGPVL